MPIWQKGRVNMRDNYIRMRRTQSNVEILKKYRTVMDALSYVGNGFFPDMKIQLMAEKDQKVISTIQKKVFDTAYDILDSCIEYIDWDVLRLYKDLVTQFCYSNSKQLMSSICNTITALMLEEIDEISDFYGKLLWKIRDEEEKDGTLYI